MYLARISLLLGIERGRPAKLTFANGVVDRLDTDCFMLLADVEETERLSPASFAIPS